MSILQLRTFVEVYRQGSLGKAAEVLGLTQPAVSNHIASLEAQIERPLFVRHSRGVRPTDIADDLASQLRDTIDHAEAALARMKARSADLKGVVHINGPIDMLSSLLAPRLKPLIDLGVQIRLHATDGDETLEQLADGLSDFALNIHPPRHGKLSHDVLGKERLRLVMAPSLAEQMGDDLEVSLPALPSVAYDLERPLARLWLEHNGLFIAGAKENITAPDLRCLRQIALLGFGWAVLPEYLIADDLEQDRLIAATGANGDPEKEYYLCWRTSAMRNPRIVRVRQLFQEQFADQ